MAIVGGSPGGSVVKILPANAGAEDLIPGSERSSGEESGNLLQYFCLENPMDSGVWQAIVHGVAKESATELTKPPINHSGIMAWIFVPSAKST